MCSRAFLLISVVLAAAAGCGGPGDRSGERPPVVAVSVLPQADLVERLAGDRVEVVVMVPPGASPVTHEPAIDQLERLADAVVYVALGHPAFPFEAAWLDRVVATREDLPVVDSSAGIRLVDGDPHLWLSPPLALEMARNIAAGLGRALPGVAAEIEHNLGLFADEVAALDAEIGARLADKRGSVFVVFHAAWGYFAERYGLVQLAIEHGATEPSPHELGQLLARIRELEVPVMLVQPQLSASRARIVADAVGARLETADPLARDWAENLRRVAGLIDRIAVAPPAGGRLAP